MLGFSPLSSAPLSALSRGGTNVKEYVSATDSQSASIISATQTITESGSSNDSSVSTSQFNQTITESGTVTESQDLFVVVNSAEILYAGDVLTGYKSFFGYQKSVINGDDGNVLFDSIGIIRSNFGGGSAQILYANQKYGIAFTASRTAQLGKVEYAQAFPYGGGVATTAGAVELWQLAGAPGSATSTLLASIPFYINAGFVGGVLNPTYDFSTVSGASLTSGTSYAILLAGGSDWVNTGIYSTSAGLLFVSDPINQGQDWYQEFVKYSSNYYGYYATSSTPVGAGGTISSGSLWSNFKNSPVMNIEYASTAVDAVDAVNAIPIKETVTASDSLSQTNASGAFINNTSPFLNSIVTSISTGTQPIAAIGEPITNGGYGKGLKFIANKTKTLSNIQINAYTINNSISSTTAPISTGKVELWQLDSNTLTGNPSILLVSKNFSLNDLPSPIQSMSSITNSLLGAASLTSSTTPTSGNNDDGWWTLSLPWNVNYLGSSYSTVYLGTNSYLTFGGGSNQYIANDAANPTLPKICISTADNSCQRMYYGTEGTAPNRTYRIVYEGTASSSGTLGSPTMVWEAVFYENNPSQIDVQIGANARAGSAQGITLPDGTSTVIPALWGVYSEEALVGAWPTTSYTNVGFRLVSKTTGYPYAYVPVNIDFSSANLSLTSGIAYAVTVTAGSDWSSSSSSYLGLYRHDAVGNHRTSAGQYPAGLPTYWYLRSVYTPIANNGSTWFAPSTDTNNIFRFTVNSTEESYATDVNTSVFPNTFSVVETGSALDYYTYISAISSAATEVGYSRDTATYLRKVPGAIVETTSGRAPLFNDYQFSTLSGGGNAMNNNYRQGWGFTATTTGQLGKVSWVRSGTGGYGNYSNGNANPSVSNGALELWQLAGAPGTAATTLIASIPVAATDFPSTGPAPLWDFSNISGAVLVAGISYAVIFSSGSDWLYTTTKTWSIQTQNSLGTDPAAWFGYRMGKVYYFGSGTVGTTTGLTSGYIWDTTTNPSNNAIPPLSIEYANNTADAEKNSLVTTQIVTENTGISATDSETGIIPGQGENITETGSASESETNLVVFVSDKTETGNAQESPSSQADFYPAVTENTGISAADSGTQSTSGAVNTITETGSANETEDRSVTATRDITENSNISATETEDRTITATRDLTETGSATETEDRSVTATRDLTETGSATETEDRSLTATRDLTETGSATETEYNIITTSSSLTETGSANETENQTITATIDLTETGSATDSETSQADFYPAVTENSGISATDSGTSKSTQYSNLIETTRKNIYANTDTFGSGWSVNNGTLTSTALTTDPFGGNGAYRLAEDTLNAIHREVYTAPHIAGTVYTLSVYVKADTRSKFVFFHEEQNTINRAGLQLDLTAGTKTNYTTGTGTVTSSTLTNEGNGWYRASFTFTATTNLSGVTHTFRLIDNLGNLTYTGDGTSGLFLYGPQFEIGSLSSYQANNTLDAGINSLVTNQSTTENTGISATDSETQTSFQTQYETEPANAQDSPSSQADFYPAVTENSGISATDGKTASAINLVDITERLLNVTDLSQVQTAFISAIQELLNASESPGTANIVSNRSLTEIVSSIESSTGLPFYAVNINELLNAVVNSTTDIPVFITETGSLTAAQLATQLATAGILEQITATEAELSQLISTSYISEISVAGESTIVWIFYPMDYELVSSRPSTLIDIDSDEIYFDDIDVFYLDSSKIMADVDVTFDQIYIDNIDVLYGNIALIDSAIDDEIYI